MIRTIVLLLALAAVAFGQGETASGITVIGTFQPPTSGTLPGTCTVGQLYYKTGASAGLHTCSSTNTWSLLTAGSGITSFNGLTPSSQSFGNDTNVTVSSAGSTHTLGWSGTLAVARGGTGAGTLTGILRGNGTSAFTALDSATIGQVLRVGAGPTIGFGAVDLADADAVTGLLADANIAATIARDSEVAAAYQPLQTTLTTIGGLATTDDNLMVANGTTWQLKALPDCSNATTSKVLYNISTNSFSCGTDQSGSASAGGSDTQVQFNASGSFAGDAGMTYNSTTDTLTVATVIAALVGNASTASSLAANGGNCTGNNFAVGVDGAGVAECAPVAFSNLGTGVNVTATMTVGAGASLIANDNALSIRDQTDTTKLVQFELSGLTTATTRTLTVPDASLTLVGTTTTQTLTNKTLTTPTIGDFTNSGHNHTNAAGGGQITDAALSSAVTVAKGGTGATTLTGLLQGNGTGAITGITNSSTVGQILRVTGASTYAWGALDLADGDAITGTIPDGNIPSGIARDSEVSAAYLPLAGGTLTGQLVTDNLGVEFDESDTNPTCAAGNYNIFADLSENKLKKCTNGSVSDLDTTGGTPSFDGISGGTNTTAAMLVGSGGSLGVTGTGTITATGVAASAGAAPTANGNIAYDSTANQLEYGDNGTNRVVVNLDEAQTLTNKTLTTPVISSIINTGTVTLFTATDTVVGKATTDTLTNKTIDAEGTGNSITTVEKAQIKWVGCAGTTGTVMMDTLATLAPTATCSAGSTEALMMRGVLDFPDSDGLYSVQDVVLLPADFTGAIDVRSQWRAAATTGNVVWQVSTACRADAQVDDVAWNTASTVTETAKGTTNQLNEWSITGITATDCSAGELMHIRVARDRTHASDTITGVVSLAGALEITMRRAQ